MALLRKDVIITYIPAEPGSPGDPGAPAIPAYCATIKNNDVWGAFIFGQYSSCDELLNAIKGLAY